MARNGSRLMAQRLRMEAVHSQTSMANQTLHQSVPNGQYPSTSLALENGRTARPSRRSDTASEMMKVLVTERNFRFVKTDAMTRLFPAITRRSKATSRVTGSPKVIAAVKASLASARSVGQVTDRMDRLHSSEVTQLCTRQSFMTIL